jgi:hypothetical protein
MLRWTAKLLILTLLVAGGAVGLYAFQFRDTTTGKLRAAEQRVEQLKTVVRRLHGERRVADIIVTDQEPLTTRPATAPALATSPTTAPAGTATTERTTLLFVEYARDGTPLPARRFTIDGNVAHLDAMVIKFDGKFVEENDPLRGHSVALFTRLYGESQSPEKGFPIDPPNGIPEVYRGRDPKVPAFETELWQNFWRLAEDETYRKEMGVRVAQGEGVWTRFLPDRLYTVTLESDGGLNITSTPLKGIYREALRRQASL